MTKLTGLDEGYRTNREIDTPKRELTIELHNPEVRNTIAMALSFLL